METNVAICVCSYVGVLIWIFGIFGTIVVIFGSEGSIIERIQIGIVVFLFFFLLGMAFAIEGLTIPTRDINYTYETPTSIIKTNDVTIVNYVKDGRVLRSFASSEAKYWNSTNIMIEIKRGKGFWKYFSDKEMKPKCQVVIR